MTQKNIWICEDGLPKTQRKGRYVEDTICHPSKNYPCVMRKAVELVSRKGETILDPMCGIGTTLVEAADIGRSAFGVEIEPRFAAIAAENALLATKRSGVKSGRVICGDSCKLSKLIHTQVDHIVMSPPFTCELISKHHHGLKGSRPRGKKYLRNFSVQGNIAHATPHGTHSSSYSPRMSEIYFECYRVLKSKGKMAIILRNPYRKGDEEDLIGETITLCKQAGFQLKGRVVHVLPNITLWRLCQAKSDKSRIPDYTETVLVFQKHETGDPR